MRQLIASGDHKAALEGAKALHHASDTVVSRELLVDAYAERIRALIRRNLPLEASSLIDLVRQRYPFARKRLNELFAPVAPTTRALDDLVRSLNDPTLDAATRATIERDLQRGVWDLGALAACEALPADHSLRTSAAALEQAFVAATSGPVAEDALTLPEVSRRSPLAPWKLLTRAIASFYRGESGDCQHHLDGIDPASAPARLVPAIQALLGGEVAVPLTPAAATLRARITRETAMRGLLEELDQAFASANKGRILKAIRSAVAQCQQDSPDQLESLRQHISVRCAMADLDPAKVQPAMGGPSRHDATFLRLFARRLEESQNAEHLVLACKLWEEFRRAAVQEGWFAPNGGEVAAVSLRIANLLRKVPEGPLRELQWSARAQAKASGEDLSYLFPEQQYQRACVLDPHPDAFSQWMDWASRQPGGQAERVAAAWHKVRPTDLAPVLHLMHAAEAGGNFGKALGYLAKVERIDGLHAGAPGTRLRLLVGSTLRHLQQKKPVLAAQDVKELSALPQAQQGDRPALLAALRVGVSAARGDGIDAAARADVARLLGSEAAAALLIFVVSTRAKQRTLGELAPVTALSRAERASLPGAVARVCALASDVHLTVALPRPWVAEVAKRFPATAHALDAGQLRRLAESALLAGHVDLAYAISTEGLRRGGATEVRFLLIRAQSVTGQIGRRVVCARAAAVLARPQQDMDLVEEAGELVRGLVEFDHVSLTLDQARDVLQQEKAAPSPPRRNRPGPAYADLIGGQCQCAKCRRARGGGADPFADLDDDFDDDFEDEEVGFEMPPEAAAMFAEEIDKAIRRGESPADFLARMVAGGSRPRRSKKGKPK